MLCCLYLLRFLCCAAQDKVAGGEGGLGVYGTLRPRDVHRILVAMVKKARLMASSGFFDAGAGLGR